MSLTDLGWRGRVRAFTGIVWREGLRFLHQRERFLSALVRPLVWLFIFAAGFRAVLGLSITPPYQTYVLYEVYVTPGLVGDDPAVQRACSRRCRWSTTARPARCARCWSARSRAGSCSPPSSLAGVAVSILQAYAFLAIAWLWGIRPPPLGYLTVLPALILSGMMLGAHRPVPVLGDPPARELRRGDELRHLPDVLRVAPRSTRFGGMRESSVLLHDIAAANPFTHAVELIRFALYGQIEPVALGRGRLQRRVPRRHDLHLRPVQGPLARPDGRKPMIRAPASEPSWPPAPASPPGRSIPTGPASSDASRSLSMAQVWAGPPPDAATEQLCRGRRRCRTWPRSSRCAARRWRRPKPRSPPSPRDHEPRALTALFVATLDHINPARDRVMAGITRYAHKQEALDVADRASSGTSSPR